MSDWNLPDGCSERDVNKAAGDDAEDCQRCNKSFCAYELDENGMCESCAEEKKAEDEEEEE